MHFRRSRIATAVVLATAAGSAPALNLQFDYTYDGGGFFGAEGSVQRQAMAAAAKYIGDNINDDLLAIENVGTGTVRLEIDRPDTGQRFTLPEEGGTVVAADTLLIYAGARSLGGSALGEGVAGGYSIPGSSFPDPNWENGVRFRGEVGATSESTTSTDYGPWGGYITFDSTRDWFFDPDPAHLPVTGDADYGDFSSGYDFFSVAVHELAHLMGFGTAKSWDFDTDEAANLFDGPFAMAKNGDAGVPLDSQNNHWQSATQSTVNGQAQEAALDPSLNGKGVRKYLTDLDWAALEDVGWEVAANPNAALLATPLPSAIWLLVAPLLGLSFYRKNR